MHLWAVWHMSLFPCSCLALRPTARDDVPVSLNNGALADVEDVDLLLREFAWGVPRQVVAHPEPESALKEEDSVQSGSDIEKEYDEAPGAGMPSAESRQIAASVGNKLNRKEETEAGYPIACDVPLCDRSDGCEGKACCNTRMFEAVSKIADWMESKGIDYTLLFGTLLGAYRDNDVIPWTDDIDLGIYRKDVHRIIEQADIPWNFGFSKKWYTPLGCEYHCAGFPGEYSGHVDLEALDPKHPYTVLDSHPLNHSYYIDLYVMDVPHCGGHRASKCLASSWGEDGMLQRTTVTIRGKRFHSPLHIEDCLVAEYGENWATPDANFVSDLDLSDSTYCIDFRTW